MHFTFSNTNQLNQANIAPVQDGEDSSVMNDDGRLSESFIEKRPSNCRGLPANGLAIPTLRRDAKGERRIGILTKDSYFTTMR